jgi:hypothetical protein
MLTPLANATKKNADAVATGTEDPQLSFSTEGEYTVYLADVADNIAIVSNEICCNLPADRSDVTNAVTYTSSDKSVATVDKNGDLNLRYPGQTVITATYPGSDKYAATTISYTLNVELIEESKAESEDGTPHLPLIFDENNIILPYSQITDSGSIMTHQLTIMFLNGYTIKYQHKYDSDNMADEVGELTMSSTFGGEYESGVLYPYGEEEEHHASGEIDLIINSKTNSETNKLSIPISMWTGVDDIAVESSNATPVYYNLLGVRVAEPKDGIFIRVAGNKAEKVLF